MEVLVPRAPAAAKLDVFSVDLKMRMNLDRSIVRVVSADDQAATVAHQRSEGLVRAMVGVVIGLGVSAATSRLMSSFLYGLTATDAATFVAGAGVLCGVTALASYVPARRAGRVDPMTALRAD